MIAAVSRARAAGPAVAWRVARGYWTAYCGEVTAKTKTALPT